MGKKSLIMVALLALGTVANADCRKTVGELKIDAIVSNRNGSTAIFLKESPQARGFISLKSSNPVEKDMIDQLRGVFLSKSATRLSVEVLVHDAGNGNLCRESAGEQFIFAAGFMDVESVMVVRD